MTDVIKKMCKAYDAEMIGPDGASSCLRAFATDAMRAAITALADNVSDEMARSFKDNWYGEEEEFSARDLAGLGESIAACLRSLLQNE